MAKKKVIPIPLKTEKATIVVPALVPAVLLDNKNVAPTTTAEQDIASQEERDALHRMRTGQRRVNITWEFTQGGIAILLVATVCIAIIMGKQIGSEFWILVSIVVQSYFQRTNHTRVGGIGEKRDGETR